MKSFLLNFFSPLSEPFLILKGALLFLIGPLNFQLSYLLIAIFVDLCFGIQVARKEHEFSWGTLYTSVRKKILVYMLWITLFHAFDMVAGLPDTARWAVVMMLVGFEIFSAIKNTAKLGHTRLAEGLEQIYFALIKVNPPREKETQRDERNYHHGHKEEAEQGGRVQDEDTKDKSK